MTRVLHPDYLYVFMRQAGAESVAIDSVDASSIEISSVRSAIGYHTFSIGYNFSGSTGYHGDVHVSSGGIDVALLTWVSGAAQAVVNIEGSPSDETLKGLRCNNGYLFFGGDMSGVDAFREIGDLDFFKMNAASTQGFISYIELPQPLDQSAASPYAVTSKDQNDTLSQDEVLVYPNPASADLHIKANFTILELAITNLAGQDVYSSRPLTGFEDINVAVLQPGVYIISVRSTSTIITHKILIQ